MVNELNLSPKTLVKIENIDVKVLEGDLKEKPWLIENDNKNYVLLEESQYNKLLDFLKDVLDKNLEFKMEQKILNEMPLDYEDVKAVVKKEIDEKHLSIEEAIKEVKFNYPNLFHQQLDIEHFLEEFLV